MLYAGANAGSADPGAYGESGDAPDDGGVDVSDGGECATLLSRLTSTCVSRPLKRIALGPVRGGGEGGGGEATTGGGDGGGAGAEETTRFTPASHKTSAGSEDETTVICGLGSLPSAEGRVSVDSSPPSSNAQYATKESYERCQCTGGIAW